jgi:hypothetical protein
MSGSNLGPFRRPCIKKGGDCRKVRAPVSAGTHSFSECLLFFQGIGEVGGDGGNSEDRDQDLVPLAVALCSRSRGFCTLADRPRRVESDARADTKFGADGPSITRNSIRDSRAGSATWLTVPSPVQIRSFKNRILLGTRSKCFGLSGDTAAGPEKKRNQRGS